MPTTKLDPEYLEDLLRGRSIQVFGDAIELSAEALNARHDILQAVLEDERQDIDCEDGRPDVDHFI